MSQKVKTVKSNVEFEEEFELIDKIKVLQDIHEYTF